MSLLEPWLALAHRLSRYAICFGGALLLVAAFVVSVDVVLRKLWLVSLGGADELSGYAFAIGTSWALAFTLLQRANVRVDALYVHLPSALRAALDVLALLSLGLFVGLLAWQAWVVLDTSIAFEARANTPLQTPLWIPQSLWLLGLVLFAFAWLPLMLRALLALLGGRFDVVTRVAGARSIEEDAADEVSQAAHLRQDGSEDVAATNREERPLPDR